MRPLLLILLVATIGGMQGRASDQEAAHSYVPPKGFVPDSLTATRIAEAVWIPIYGASDIRRERPYKAKLRDSIWTVTGSLPSGTVGGVALIEINKRDGRVLRVSHGR